MFLLDDFLIERVRLRREKSRRVEIIILVAVIGLVVIPFVLSFLLELTNKKGVATALKSALSATGSYLADTCLKLVVFIYAVGYIFGVWG